AGAQAGGADRRRGPVRGLAGHRQPALQADRRRAGRPDAPHRFRDAAEDGGVPAGGTWRRAGRPRGRRPGTALGPARSLHVRGVRNDGRTVMSSLLERWPGALMNNYGPPPLALVRGEGAVVVDETGKSYVDMLAGLAVNVLGHAHPAVVA